MTKRDPMTRRERRIDLISNYLAALFLGGLVVMLGAPIWAAVAVAVLDLHVFAVRSGVKRVLKRG